jgi:hypothetical protein
MRGSRVPLTRILRRAHARWRNESTRSATAVAASRTTRAEAAVAASQIAGANVTCATRRERRRAQQHVPAVQWLDMSCCSLGRRRWLRLRLWDSGSRLRRQWLRSLRLPRCRMQMLHRHRLRGCGAIDADCAAGEGCADSLCAAKGCEVCHGPGSLLATCLNWTCAIAAYGDGKICDCGCGAPDPDCSGYGCSEPGCRDAMCSPNGCHDPFGRSVRCP